MRDLYGIDRDCFCIRRMSEQIISKMYDSHYTLMINPFCWSFKISEGISVTSKPFFYCILIPFTTASVSLYLISARDFPCITFPVVKIDFL